MKRLRSAAAVTMAFVWVLATLVAPAALAQAATVISITTTLSPLTVTVESGTTVQWVNNDGERHRMRTTNSPAEFDSGNLEPGESFSVTLETPGIYLYVDDRDDANTAYHGAITVEEVGATDPGDPPPPPAASGDVSMAGRQFSPTSLTVAEGATVSFVNDDDRDHTVTATGGSFDSGTMSPGATYNRTFATAGTYAYFCVFHPDMVGTILVTGADGEPPPPANEPPPPPPPAPVAGDVEIVDFAFGPTSLVVTEGSTVTWGNNGVAPHTVTDRAGSFDSGLINAGGTYSRTFATAGTYNYFCTLHPDMVATLVVTDATGEAPPPAAEEPPPTPAAPVAGDVEMVDFAFGPATLTVPMGSTVTWGNNGAAPHTVTDRAGAFDSGIVDAGGTYRRTFTDPGTFNYFCTLHPQMTGTLVVTDATGEAPPAEEPATGGTAAPAPPGALEMRDFSYSPSSITIRAGGTLTWFNSGLAPHTVTASGFDSGLVQPGGSYRRTFDTPGTYNYLCTIHPQMRGVVVVTDDEGNAPSAEETDALSGGSSIAELLRQSAARRAILSATDEEGPLVQATMFEFGYDPDPVVAGVGSTVLWTNTGQAPHTVTDQEGSFDSDWIDPGGVWQRQFDEVGDYEIFCTIHPEMVTTLKIVETLVQGDGPANGGPTVLAGGSELAVDAGPSAWHQTPMSAVGAIIIVLGFAAVFGGGLFVAVRLALRH